VVECKELVVVVPPERLPRRAVRGVGAHSPQRRGFGWFLLERFLFGFRESFFSPRAICYPQAHPQGIGAYIMTYSGREEERAPSIYRSSSLVALSGGVEGAPFQRVFLRGRKSFSSRQSFSFDERFS
jgi:hypothetical protein